jgi:hypothetical protein
MFWESRNFRFWSRSGRGSGWSTITKVKGDRNDALGCGTCRFGNLRHAQIKNGPTPFRVPSLSSSSEAYFLVLEEPVVV